MTQLSRGAMREYMRDYRGRSPLADSLRALGFEVGEEHRERKRFSETDKAVLQLAKAGMLDQEIMEALDLSAAALHKHLERVAEYLAPSPAAKSVEDCIPFNEAIQ